MENDSALKVLLVAEGSGGHLIPALQVAKALAKSGARTKVWYAQRQQMAPLADALVQETSDGLVDVDAIATDGSRSLLGRLWQCGQLWHRAQRCFDTFSPDVVVGFGGWICAPIVLAARRQRIGCVLHEQNVVMGKANRWLAPWVDQIALSFPQTRSSARAARSLITGMPVRQTIGQLSRHRAAQQFGFDPSRPTLLVLGGSQGSRALNQLMLETLPSWSAEERQRWQVIHLTGPADEHRVAAAYAQAGVTARVASYVVEMGAAYAHADLVVARAGASTIAELAKCGTPALLIPYPYAGGHQRANARLVETVGGGLMLEERAAHPDRLMGAFRRLLADARLRAIMGAQMQTLNFDDAAERLTQAIAEVANGRTRDHHPRSGGRFHD